MTMLGGAVHESADAGEEAEVSHVVGLVEDGHLDRVELHVALADEVLEAARAGDDNVNAVAQGGHLRVLANATENNAGGESERLRDRGKRLFNLADELPGRGENQGARAARRPRSLVL